MSKVDEIDKEIKIFAEQNQDDNISENVGMFTIKSANETIVDASKRPDPKQLWMELWYEGEVCCLFADSNLGKSIYAVQIATEIAKHQKVLYFDFELSDKQFQLRYTSDIGCLHKFPDILFRVEFNNDGYNGEISNDNILSNIEQEIIKTDSKVIIIDNLTYLSNTTEKGEEAGTLMIELKKLKRKHNLSILIIAHTPKRQLFNPITQNDLAGSKKLYNFFDSVFAIGQSATDSGQRYIKQIKTRNGEYVYDKDNVISCVIEKDNAFTKFIIKGYEDEKSHLKEQGDDDRNQKIAEVKRLHGEGKTQRDIATILSLSLGCVNKYLRK